LMNIFKKKKRKEGKKKLSCKDLKFSFPQPSGT
jgi:hypothetical protein